MSPVERAHAKVPRHIAGEELSYDARCRERRIGRVTFWRCWKSNRYLRGEKVIEKVASYVLPKGCPCPYSRICG